MKKLILVVLLVLSGCTDNKTKVYIVQEVVQVKVINDTKVKGGVLRAVGTLVLYPGTRIRLKDVVESNEQKKEPEGSKVLASKGKR